MEEETEYLPSSGESLWQNNNKGFIFVLIIITTAAVDPMPVVWQDLFICYLIPHNVL